MQESEFRDWARRAQGSFDERLKALEAKVGAIELGPLRFRMPGYGVDLEGLLKKVGEEVSGGGVVGLGVIVVGEDGVVRTGWVSEDFAQYALAGGVGQLSMAILDRVMRGALEAGAGGPKGVGSFSSAAGAASGGTDEGSPEAREVAASAPAGGA
jgi:hypothetical protein